MILEKFAEQLQEIHNHVCILYDSHIVRFLGVAQAAGELFYVVSYPTYSRNYVDEDVVYAPAGGYIFSLKDSIPNERYMVMDNILELNGSPKVSEFFMENT